MKNSEIIKHLKRIKNTVRWATCGDDCEIMHVALEAAIKEFELKEKEWIPDKLWIEVRF